MSLFDRCKLAVLRLGLAVAGALPLAVLQGLARWLAWLSRIGRSREAEVAVVNLQLCYPQLAAAARERMRREVLWHTAATLLESARIWAGRQPPLHWVTAVVGREHLDAARAGGRGVIIAAPHLGNWELLGHYLASLGPFTLVYRPPTWAPAEALLRRGRGGSAVEQLCARPGSVRGMLRALQQGRLLGLLPDQMPREGEGVLVELFGRPAQTMTLLARLAARAEVEVVFAYAERLPQAAGFCVHFQPAPPDIAAAEPVPAARALNAGIEACIAQCPPQYQWTYKRYPRCPADGSPNPYRPPTDAAD